MSEASAIRLQGFKELLASSGETVDFRTNPIKAIVNRGLAAAGLAMGEVNFSERDTTHIELLRTAVTPPPRVGEPFRDSEDRNHRIEKVTTTDITYKLDCQLEPIS